MNSIVFAETCWQDLRYSLRVLAKSPRFASVVIVSLALGIGANTAIFSLINAALLKMLPVRNPEQIVQLTSQSPDVGLNDAFSYPAFQGLRHRDRAFAGVLAFRRLSDLSLEVNGQGGLAKGQVVSGDYFAVLGVRAIVGRTITPDDDKIAGASPVAVIGYDYWRERFALDPGIAGKKIILNNSPFTIIGVTPPEFFGVQPGERIDVSVPIAMVGQVWQQAAMLGTPYDVMHAPFRNWLNVMARLQPGVAKAEALANAQPVFREAMREAAQGMAGLPFDSPAARRNFLNTTLQLNAGGQGLATLRRQFSKPLFILMAVVALLLLVTCANVANLLLARANARQKEIAVRLTIGAGRPRLIRQLITESVLLAGCGGVLGLLFAFGACKLLLVLMAHSRSPISISVQPDARVLAFTLLISLFTALLFGLIPAWQAARLDLTPALLQTTRNFGKSGNRSRLGKALVILQVAVSLVLLVGAGLLTRSLANLRDFYPGFNKENVLLFSVNTGMVGYKEAQLVPLYERLLDRIRALPGVRFATLATHTPLGRGFGYTQPTVEGYKPPPGKELSTAGVEVAGLDYFRTLGISVLSGRDFTAGDWAGAPKVAVINETMAQHYFADANPLGRRLKMPGWRGDPSWLTIIAVIKDTKYHDLRERASPMVYISLLQYPESGVTFAVRTRMNPAGAASAILQAVKKTDSRLPVYGVKMLSEQLDDSLLQERLVASLSSLFGALALLLAGVGLYGLTAYTVNRRTNEIGIRIALGAKRTQIARMVLRETLLLIIMGLAIGLPASFGASRLIASELYGLKSGDPSTILVASFLLAAIAAIATYLPARRASRVDPMVALRYE